MEITRRSKVSRRPAFFFLLSLACLIATSVVSLTDVERTFLDVPSADSARESLRFITSKPHTAGTAGDLEMATYVHDYFVSEGIPSVEIQPVDALLSAPVSSSLQLLRVDGDPAVGGGVEVVFDAALSEDVLDIDATSDTWYRNHTFNGYSPSGNVTAQMVYANYGRPEDFDALEAAGVSVDGTIVIIRYGKCFRGLKAMNAQARGAVGVIIYSDPQQCGSTWGPTYPDGGWRPSFSVQRGSVVFNSLCIGDPSRAAADRTVEEICGFSLDELRPLVPVMPISYGDAEPFLRGLGGTVAPEGFQGGLNFTYTLGPSGPSNLVRMCVENEEHVGPVWNVIGTIPGTLPIGQDRPIILGNHRDAWVFGAVDPNSGTSALIEVARGLGALLEGGWRPRRTIVLCSWSGEELGMVGSTAWGEANAEGLLANAAVYLNVDCAVDGHLLRIKATPSLSGLLGGVLSDINDPDTGKTLFEAWSGDVQMLGSGSDYAVFLHHLGVATVDFEFQVDLHAQYGVYHSIYDSFSWVDNYGDPGFRYFRTAACLWGLMALRLADPEILPFDPTCQATAIEKYLADLVEIDEDGGGTDGSIRLAATDFTPLKDAVGAFRAAADSVGSWAGPDSFCGISATASQQDNSNIVSVPFKQAQRARAVGLRTGVVGSSGDGGLRGTSGSRRGSRGLLQEGRVRTAVEGVGGLNERLTMTERRFLSEDGLPGRPWFQHVLQAPGLYLGYAAESFPGITQALSDGDKELAQEQVLVVAACVMDAAEFLSGGTTP